MFSQYNDVILTKYYIFIYAWRFGDLNGSPCIYKYIMFSQYNDVILTKHYIFIYAWRFGAIQYTD